MIKLLKFINLSKVKVYAVWCEVNVLKIGSFEFELIKLSMWKNLSEIVW